MNFAIRLFVAVTLFLTMLGLGLGLHSQSLRDWIKQPSLALRVALGSSLLIPLLGMALLHGPWGSAISSPMRAAMALMALCPSAPLAMRKVRKYGGDHDLAALIQVMAALMALVSIPSLSGLFPHAFAVSGWHSDGLQGSVPMARDLAVQVGRVQVLPLLLGLRLRHVRPALADRLERPLNRIANLLLLILVGLILFSTSRFLLRFIGHNLDGLLLMALQVLGCLLIGRWLAAGEQRSLGATTALVTAMRNPGLALLFVSRFGDEVHGLRLAILLYVLLTALISVPWLRFSRRLERTG